MRWIYNYTLKEIAANDVQRKIPEVGCAMNDR